MRHGALILVAAIATIGVFAGGLAWLLTDTRPRAGASRGERLYYAYCAECHGVDGRGSWRAALFLLRPGNLTDTRIAADSDRYLFDLIKHGGATIGRSGMPAFGAQLSDDDIALLVAYVRRLASTSRPRAAIDRDPAARHRGRDRDVRERQRSRFTQTSTISSPCGRTASVTRSPRERCAASSISGAPRTAIISIAPMPSAVSGWWRISSRSGAARATTSPRTS
jgi:cytochrome c oxidase cbb3-type subunit 3